MAAQLPSGSSEEEPDFAEQGTFVDINVTPMVDIFLVLLVILMATSTAMVETGAGEQSGFKVQLPAGSESEADDLPGEQLVIAISSEGEVVVRGELVSMSELETLLKAEAAKGPGRVVVVQADENARHKRVVEVMEQARKVGLNNLAIATQK